MNIRNRFHAIFKFNVTELMDVVKSAGELIGFESHYSISPLDVDIRSFAIN